VFLRRAAIAISILFAVTAIAIVLIVFQQRNRLYSDPAAPRESKAFSKAFTATTNALTVDTHNFTTTVVRSNATEVRIEVPSRFSSPPDYQPPFLLAEGSNTVSFAQTQLSLQTIAVNCTGSVTNAAYFTPAGNRLDPVAMRRKLSMWSGGATFRGSFPRAEFHFESTNLSPEVMILGFQVFDRRTRRLLTSGHSSSMQGPTTTRIWIAADIELWHQTPIDLVLTIATGPTKLTTHPIDLNAAPIPYPGGMLKLLHLGDTEINSWGTDFNNGTNYVTLSGNRESDEAKTSLVFFSWPTLQGVPIQIQMTRRDGTPAQHTGRSSSENLLIATVVEKPTELGAIEMRYYPNVYRLVFHLPELPGLPEANRNLQNLFDTHIPQIHVPYQYAYQTTIMKLIAMEGPQLPLNYSNLFFPVIRTNTTARELFREMEILTSDPEKVIVVDSGNNKLRYERSTFYSFLHKAKKKLGL
jgi:hypothetical protein